ncbi:MAG: DUF2147 domain-containing protein [Roseibium sp.]|nr:DUF2147 domain-containing protein [Roseibium sp.]
MAVSSFLSISRLDHKARISGLLATVFTLFLVTGVQAAPDINGKWRTPDGAVVQVSRCGSAPCGKIISFHPPAGKAMETVRDERNKDASKRNRKILGLTVLWRLQPDGSAWSGRVYDPRRGFSANATVRKTGGSRLEIKGCVRVVFNVCEQEVWQRVK